jgi:hypothetical protein
MGSFDKTLLPDTDHGLSAPILSSRDNPFFSQKGGYKVLCNSYKLCTIHPFWDCVTFSNNTSPSVHFTKITMAGEAIRGTQVNQVNCHPFLMTNNRI